MSIATETRELTSLKMEIIHKLFLVNLLEAKGFQKAIVNRIGEDIEYLSTIANNDLKMVKLQLEQELFEL